MGHIVFLTLYLGLVSGQQPIEVQADAAVVTMKFELDGRAVATLTRPPWRATIDFGRGIEPQELVAIGYDRSGAEVGRAAQSINLPRPTAEGSIVLENDAKGAPKSAEVRWRHISNEKPRTVTLRLDDHPLKLDRNNRVTLPALDLAVPHLLSAEVQFPNGVTRPELVFGGTLPDSTGSQLTATLVRQTGDVPGSLDGCFSVDGSAIRAQTIEKPPALVIVVRDPSAYDAVASLIPPTAKRSIVDINATARTAKMADDTRIRLMWPVADRVLSPDAPTSVLFRYSGDFASDHGLLWYLTQSHEGKGDYYKRQFTDAVAVAGVQAMTGGRRRAVILVLGRANDASRYDPPTVRRYLQSIGVPLFVWTLVKATPDLIAKWGDVVEVTNQEKLRQAAEVVKKALDEQRIAWLDADPIHALHAEVKGTCGLER